MSDVTLESLLGSTAKRSLDSEEHRLPLCDDVTIAKCGIGDRSILAEVTMDVLRIDHTVPTTLSLDDIHTYIRMSYGRMMFDMVAGKVSAKASVIARGNATVRKLRGELAKHTGIDRLARDVEDGTLIQNLTQLANALNGERATSYAYGTSENLIFVTGHASSSELLLKTLRGIVTEHSNGRDFFGEGGMVWRVNRTSEGHMFLEVIDFKDFAIQPPRDTSDDDDDDDDDDYEGAF